jgi:rhodanese-related sulfurtransferase
MPLSRRSFIGLGAFALIAGGAGFWRWAHPVAAEGVERLTVTDAHRAALAGDILLIDIRRPDEWARTGIGEGAEPLDMRRPDFVAALMRLTGGDPTRPVALICARGVRSARLTRVLAGAGFTRIHDVPEGMLGSGAGPGWVKTGLPVRAAS